MWKLLAEAEGRTARENALWMKEHLEALKGVIPEIVSCEVGVNVEDESLASNYDACLVAQFRSLEDLETYKHHPEHVKVSSYCKKVRESRVACDYVVDE